MVYVINYATFSELSLVQPDNNCNWVEFETLAEAEALVEEDNIYHEACRDEDINEGRENSIYY